jgi:hypothetical protein
MEGRVLGQKNLNLTNQTVIAEYNQHGLQKNSKLGHKNIVKL